MRVNQHKKHEKSGGNIFEKCLVYAVSRPVPMLHRSLFDEYGYFDETMPACEDYDMWLRLAHLRKCYL